MDRSVRDREKSFEVSDFQEVLVKVYIACIYMFISVEIHTSLRSYRATVYVVFIAAIVHYGLQEDTIMLERIPAVYMCPHITFNHPPPLIDSDSHHFISIFVETVRS
jgi:hypothetical protein